MFKNLKSKHVFTTVIIAVAVYGIFIHPKVSKNNPEEVSAIEEKIVNVYSSRKEELTKDLFDQFTKESGIKVNFIIDKAPKLIERIKSEGANTQADLFLTADIGNIYNAKKQGLLQQVQSDYINNNIPENLRDGYWYGLTKRVRAIFYNKENVKEVAIDEYEDLANSELQGKVLIRSSSNIYNQSLIASMIENHGKEGASKWLTGLVANFARTPQGGDTDQLKALAAGEGDYAVANSYYYGRLLASENEEDKAVSEKIGIIFPNQQGRGAHINVSGGGVVKNAKHFRNAVSLLEFLSSPDAQKIYAERNYEYPVNQNVKASAIVQSWGEFKEDKQGMKAFIKHLPEAIKLADKAGWR